ncbi:hypothetical protein JY98_08715 [Exiguobacterium mexicanum]|nr:hypothetical protein JY98_08715 [Exiguobacterium mexicanum]
MNVILLGSQYLAEKSNGNFQRTVINRVPLIEHKTEFSEKDKNALQNAGLSFNQSYPMWAVNKMFSEIFNEISIGDIVLFYSKNRYHHCAKVKYVFEGQYSKIAEKLWTEDKYNQLLILEELAEIDYARDVIHENMGEPINDFIVTGIRISSNPNFEFVKRLPLTFSRQQDLISGDKGATDQIAKKDYLARENLINKIAQFYIGFTQKNSNETKSEGTQLFLGVFAKWGKGKSSFIHLLHEEIKKQVNQSGNKKQTYIITKVDCSLVDQKETLWLNILNLIIDEMEQKRKEIKAQEKQTGVKGLNPFKWKSSIRIPGFSNYELRFNLSNIVKVLLGKRLLITFYILLAAASFILIDPPSEFKLDVKNTSGIVTLTMLLVTIVKTFNLRLGQIFLPNKYTQVTNSYFKSKDEFEQLLKITEKLLKDDHSIRILITLDEIDRMNKSLLPELMECLQLFKGIKQTNRVSLQFLFSFNHDIVFPNIGKSLTMNDPYLLVDSFAESFRNRDTVHGTTRINSYQLGKEYMDKYLDLSIYLDDIPSYNDLVDNIFKVSSDSNSLNIKNEMTENSDVDYTEVELEINSEINEENDVNNTSSEKAFQPDIISSFTKEELSLIKEAIEKQKEYVEPRKLIRLNNVLILIKNLDLDKAELSKESENELAIFVYEFLSDSDDVDGNSMNRQDYKILKSAPYFLDKRSNENQKSKGYTYMWNPAMGVLLPGRPNEQKIRN